MDDEKFLAERFEQSRRHLRSVAYRMLGSASEADDAVQEAWLRLSRVDVSDVGNLTGWLTTVVARVCLDMLRSRKAKREAPLEDAAPQPAAADPGRDVELADSVGLALLVVLETLSPAERIAFVLHDMFDLPFEEISPIVGRTPTAARQLASRARRRVQGASAPPTDLDRQRQVVDAFLAAARGGDFEGLVKLLDPDVVFRSDQFAVRLGGQPELRGPEAVANAFKGRAQAARTALLDSSVHVIVAPAGRLLLVLRVHVRDGRIAIIDAIADPEQLKGIDPVAISG